MNEEKKVQVNTIIDKVLKKIEKGEKQVIWFDIDGTLANTQETDYGNAEKIEAMALTTRMLYDMGHTIIIVTARGGKSGKDWRKTTEKQLEEWGIKYHKLITGYPKDIIIDDSALRPEEFLELLSINDIK